jgi:hypothetical protein
VVKARFCVVATGPHKTVVKNPQRSEMTLAVVATPIQRFRAALQTPSSGELHRLEGRCTLGKPLGKRRSQYLPVRTTAAGTCHSTATSYTASDIANPSRSAHAAES